MIKKIIYLSLTSLFLGGCTLTDFFKPSTAVQDSQPEVVATSTPAPTPTPLSSSSDETSLEEDINNTVILDEDFSDLN